MSDDNQIYEGIDSPWERGQDAIERARHRLTHPGGEPRFPTSLEKLLASKEWRGSTVRPSYDGAQLVITHPCGAEMRIRADYFSALAASREATRLWNVEAKRLRDERRDARNARKAGMTRHVPG